MTTSAAELLIKSKRPIIQVARELGVSEPSLRDWKRKYVQDPGPEGQFRVRQTFRDLEAENQRWREENLYLGRQRDILRRRLGHLLRIVAERHVMIQSLSTEYPVTMLCETLGASRVVGYLVALMDMERCGRSWAGRRRLMCRRNWFRLH